jgi:hypothetical protein
MSKFLLLAAFFVSLTGTAGAAIYKWVDEQGKVHLGDNPPPGQDAEPIQAAPAPDAQDVQRSRDTLDSLLKRQQRRASKRAREAETRRQEREASQRASEIRMQHCLAAREALATLRWPGAVYAVDGKGNRQFLANNTRTEEIERATRQIQQYCD